MGGVSLGSGGDRSGKTKEYDKRMMMMMMTVLLKMRMSIVMRPIKTMRFAMGEIMTMIDDKYFSR